MNSQPEYYSISAGGYTRHTNLEVVSLDQRPLSSHRSSVQMHTPINSHRSMIIKEEQMECDPHDLPDRSQQLKFREQEQVNSIHIPFNEPMTYSCIAPKKGILKRSLQEIQQKHLKSQQDSHDEQHLYFELQNERKERKKLQQSYQDLITYLTRNERLYSIDTQNHHNQSKRNFHESSPSQPQQITYKGSQTKTIKNQRSCSQIHKKSTNKIEIDTYQQQQTEYQDNKQQFEERLMDQLENINKKIANLEEALIQSQLQTERTNYQQQIKEKDDLIAKLQLQNQQLKGQTSEKYISWQQFQQINPFTFMILIMALMTIVALR